MVFEFNWILFYFRNFVFADYLLKANRQRFLSSRFYLRRISNIRTTIFTWKFLNSPFFPLHLSNNGVVEFFTNDSFNYFNKTNSSLKLHFHKNILGTEITPFSAIQDDIYPKAHRYGSNPKNSDKSNFTTCFTNVTSAEKGFFQLTYCNMQIEFC